MPTPADIVNALRSYGLKVMEDPGWQIRSSGHPFHPYGQAIHHDALNDDVSDTTALRIMREGRPDLKGPLCNGWIDSDGTVWLVAAGNANHAGRNEADVHKRLQLGLAPLGDARLDPDGDTMVGNAFLWGWECRNAGNGIDPWDQLDAMERACAAIADVFGWTSDAIAGHRELTKRKIDPAGIDMARFRADVDIKRFQHQHPQPPPQEDDDMRPYIITPRDPKDDGYAPKLVDAPFVVNLDAKDVAAFKAAGVAVIPTSKATAAAIVADSGAALD